MPHVFDRFRQADAKVSRKAGGLGLGLAIVRSIVELHGGTVAAQSDGTNKGATFTVRLPTAPLVADSTPAPPEGPNAGAPRGFERLPELANLRILLVDEGVRRRNRRLVQAPS